MAAVFEIEESKQRLEPSWRWCYHTVDRDASSQVTVAGSSGPLILEIQVPRVWRKQVHMNYSSKYRAKFILLGKGSHKRRSEVKARKARGRKPSTASWAKGGF